MLAPKGTVLICREGSDLPFDIKLSRVIFYKYDGHELDWETVEDVVPKLQTALEGAKRGTPDSPVHALLENVFTPQPSYNDGVHAGTELHKQDSLADLDSYQLTVAEHLAAGGRPLEQLIPEHENCAFGARTLGHLCLRAKSLPPEAARIARRLFDFEQYALACDIYDGLDKVSRLGFEDLLNYGSALSE